MGAARCVYRVTWIPAHPPRATTPTHPPDATAPSPDHDGSSGQSDALRHQLDAMKERLRSVFATASDLIAVDDLDAVLARITARAALEVRAIRYLLAVQRQAGRRAALPPQGLRGRGDRRVPRAAARARSRLASGLLAGRAGGLEPPRVRPPARAARGGAELPGRGAGVCSRSMPATPPARSTARRPWPRPRSGAISRARCSRWPGPWPRPARAARWPVGWRTRSRSWSTATGLASACGTLRGASSCAERSRGTGARLSPSPPCGGRRLATGSTGWSAAAATRPLFVDETVEVRDLQDIHHQLGIAAAIMVPLMAADSFQGLLIVSVFDRPERLKPTSDLIDRLSGVAAQATTALQNGRLLDEMTHQALHDQLTGLANRLQFTDQLRSAIERARRAGPPGQPALHRPRRLQARQRRVRPRRRRPAAGGGGQAPARPARAKATRWRGSAVTSSPC